MTQKPATTWRRRRHAHKVGPKGQVVIDREIRERLGIEPGWTTSQLLVDGCVQIRFFPPDHNRSLAGALAHYVTEENRIGDRDWSEIKEQAWAEYVRERWGKPAEDS